MLKGSVCSCILPVTDSVWWIVHAVPAPEKGLNSQRQGGVIYSYAALGSVMTKGGFLSLYGSTVTAAMHILNNRLPSVKQSPGVHTAPLICMSPNPELSGPFPPPSLPFINGCLPQFIVINCTAGGKQCGTGHSAILRHQPKLLH